MRRPRRAASLLLASGLLLGAPALTACSEEPNEVVENDIEDLDDEGAVEGVDEEEAE